MAHQMQNINHIKSQVNLLKKNDSSGRLIEFPLLVTKFSRENDSCWWGILSENFTHKNYQKCNKKIMKNKVFLQRFTSTLGN